jgi:transcriptional regulator with XRE-family HTH domain
VLQEYRQAARLSQLKLADDADVDRTYLRKLEEGKSLPSLEIQFRLTFALDADIAEMEVRTGSLAAVASTLDRPRRLPRAEQRIALGEDTCPQCQAIYCLHAHRLEVRGRGKFRCVFCKYEMSSWRATTTFLYTIKQPPRNWVDKSFHARQAQVPRRGGRKSGGK